MTTTSLKLDENYDETTTTVFRIILMMKIEQHHSYPLRLSCFVHA